MLLKTLIMKEGKFVTDMLLQAKFEDIGKIGLEILIGRNTSIRLLNGEAEMLVGKTKMNTVFKEYSISVYASKDENYVTLFIENQSKPSNIINIYLDDAILIRGKIEISGKMYELDDKLTNIESIIESVEDVIIKYFSNRNE